MNEQKRRGATKTHIKNLQEALHDNSKSNNPHTVKLKAADWMRSRQFFYPCSSVVVSII